MTNKNKTKTAAVCLIVTALITAAAADEYVEFTGLEVAEKTLGFLESLKRDDGRIQYARVCDEKECRIRDSAYPESGAWLLYAYTGLYEATGDNTYRDKMDGEYEDLLENCPWTSSACAYLGVQAARAYEATGDRKFLNYLINVYPHYAVQQKHPMMKAIALRGVILKQQYITDVNWMQISSGLISANKASKKSTRLIKQGDADFRVGMCWLAVARLELAATPDENFTMPKDYAITPEEIKHSYLRAVKSFYRKMDFAGMDTWADPDSFSITLTNIEPCIEGLIMLYEQTGNESYKQDAKKLLEDMLNERWDAPESKKFEGDYSFLVQACRSDEDSISCYHNSKVASDNGYAVYLYSRMAGETFRLKKQDIKFYSDPMEDDEYYKAIERAYGKKAPVKPPAEPERKINTAQIIVLILVLAALVLAARHMAKGRQPKQQGGGENAR